MEVDVTVPMSRERKHQLQRIAARRRRPLCRVLVEFINWRAIEREAQRGRAALEKPRPARRGRPATSVDLTPEVTSAEVNVGDWIAAGGTLRDRRHG
jgi:hypothetical protein